MLLKCCTWSLRDSGKLVVRDSVRSKLNFLARNTDVPHKQHVRDETCPLFSSTTMAGRGTGRNQSSRGNPGPNSDASGEYTAFSKATGSTRKTGRNRNPSAGNARVEAPGVRPRSQRSTQGQGGHIAQLERAGDIAATSTQKRKKVFAGPTDLERNSLAPTEKDASKVFLLAFTCPMLTE